MIPFYLFLIQHFVIWRHACHKIISKNNLKIKKVTNYAKVALDITAGETQDQLSDRATQEANRLAKAGKVVIYIPILPEYAEIQYFN